MKRSEAVSLVLAAGAGFAAVSLARHDPSQHDPPQNEEDVLVYPDSGACVAGGLRSAADCRSAYETARTAYPGSAPRYAAVSACEAHHGPGQCVPGETVAETARGLFVPLMAAYVIGRTAEQALDPQPVYAHAPQNAAYAAASGGYGGYCTGSGGRIWTAAGGGSASARVASSAVRSASFGGFGATGRAFASAGHGG